MVFSKNFAILAYIGEENVFYNALELKKRISWLKKQEVEKPEKL